MLNPDGGKSNRPQPVRGEYSGSLVGLSLESVLLLLLALLMLGATVALYMEYWGSVGPVGDVQTGHLAFWHRHLHWGLAALSAALIAAYILLRFRHRRIEAHLRESERRYRQIFDATPLPMWVSDIDEPRFLAVNEAAVRKYGYTREELRGMSAIDLQHEADRELVRHQMSQRNPEQARTIRRRHVTKDGHLVHAEINAQPFVFDGRPARLVIAQDVTEQEVAHRLLLDSEARFRAVFEQAAVGISLRELSERPRHLRVNQRLCEMLGYTENELQALTTHHLTLDEDLDESHRLNLQFRTGEINHVVRVVRMRRKDGAVLWVKRAVSRIDPDGAIGPGSYLVSVVEDITAQREGEERLRDSEARYRLLFAKIPMPMYLRCENSLNVLEANEACLALYGYSREELLGQSVAVLQVGEERERYLRGLSRPVADGIMNVQKQHVCKDGRLVDVEIFAYPAMLEGRAVRLVLVRDMSGQMHTEKLLRESQRRIEMALESSEGAMFDWDVASDAVYLSEHWNRMLGCDLRETHTTFSVLSQLVHAEDLPLQRGALVKMLKEGIPQRAEFRVRRLDNSWMWIESRGRVTERDGQGRALRVLGTNIDITPRKLTEIALRERDTRLREQAIEITRLNAELEQRVEDRTRDLASVNRELESFSYSISHDLRAPLRAIDGFSRILLDEYAEKLDAAARGYLDRVRAGSHRMSSLIDDLLKLSKVTRQELTLVYCNLTVIATEVMQELQAASPERKIKLEIAEGMVAPADPGLLRIVVENLLRNAWKFTAMREEALIRIGWQIDHEWTTFFVADNGVGFDMAYSNKLFKAFQRLHSTSEFEGTGIGLALVHRVIQRHGGQVCAESVTGQGATFYFSLPRKQAAQPSSKDFTATA